MVVCGTLIVLCSFCRSGRARIGIGPGKSSQVKERLVGKIDCDLSLIILPFIRGHP